VGSAELNLRNQQVVIEAIHNSLLRSLDVYASHYVAGLDGARAQLEQRRLQLKLQNAKN